MSAVTRRSEPREPALHKAEGCPQRWHHVYSRHCHLLVHQIPHCEQHRTSFYRRGTSDALPQSESTSRCSHKCSAAKAMARPDGSLLDVGMWATLSVWRQQQEAAIADTCAVMCCAVRALVPRPQDVPACRKARTAVTSPHCTKFPKSDSASWDSHCPLERWFIQRHQKAGTAHQYTNVSRMLRAGVRS